MTAAVRPVGTWLDEAEAVLRAAGIEGPRLEARLLLAHLLGWSQASLVGRRREEVAAPDLAGLVARRAAREPLALILGHQEFWSLDFRVSAATLIPRADSETLVEAALAAFADRARVRLVLDLGTGTGCLLLAALSEFTAAWGVGVDVSPQAAALARDNAARLGLSDRAAFLCAGWASALRGRFDLILANPPYIPSGEISHLMPEVALHEPGSALDGGGDGLDAYRAILAQLPALLAEDGAAVLELGIDQEYAVRALAAAAGLLVCDVRRDLGAVPRAAVICRDPAKKTFGTLALAR